MLKKSPSDSAVATGPGGSPGLGRPRPRWLRALGRDAPPAAVEIDGRAYTLVACLKHDSWAATAVYQGPAGKVVCKFNRQQSILGLPMRWLGRALARREDRMLHEMADLPLLPRACGPVHAEGKVLPHAVAHQFIEGHPLGRGERVNDAFFPDLRRTLDDLHRRHIAYVDLHKRENIIVGADGRPYLIDFQICLRPVAGWVGRSWPVRAFLHQLQRGDDYHFHKHMVRHRPDLVPTEQHDINRLRPWPNRLARRVGNPLRALRRRLLVWLAVRTGRGLSDTEYEPEDAVKREMQNPPGTP